LSVGISKKLFAKWIKFNLEIDNLKEYHLDHVIPLIYFKCKNYDEIIKSKCNHWTNILPIKSEKNISKGDRYPTKNELLKLQLRVFIFTKIITKLNI